MMGRFDKQVDNKSWKERVAEMLKWPECEGCKKRKELLMKQIERMKKWHL